MTLSGCRHAVCLLDDVPHSTQNHVATSATYGPRGFSSELTAAAAAAASGLNVIINLSSSSSSFIYLFSHGETLADDF